MESNYDSYVKTSVEELMVEIENLHRSKRKLVLMAHTIVVAANRYQQIDPQSEEWKEVREYWSDFFHGWEARLEAQMRQLESSLWQLIALLPPHVQPPGF